MNKDTGGQAFPSKGTRKKYNGLGHNSSIINYQEEGMTLRQFYKSQAMKGLLSNRGYYMETANTCNDGLLPKDCAKLSAEYADAMIAEDN